MGIVSRGFSVGDSPADVKLPPGQYLTTDFPVLSAGPTPQCRSTGGIYDQRRHQHFAAMGLEVVSRVAHRNVHRRSTLRYAMVELGTSWEGVSLDTMLADVKTDAAYALCIRTVTTPPICR